MCVVAAAAAVFVFHAGVAAGEDSPKLPNAEPPHETLPPEHVTIPPDAAVPPGPAPGPTAPRLGGRYQALALPKDAGTTGDKMMILDTQTGDVWQWFDSPALSQYIGRTGLTYMGKLKPGTQPGETVTFRRFDAGEGQK